jgi:hypothetical protein
VVVRALRRRKRNLQAHEALRRRRIGAGIIRQDVSHFDCEGRSGTGLTCNMLICHALPLWLHGPALQGFGLQRGALGSTVAHDAHNVVVVGTDDNDMTAAVQALEKMRGGQVVIVDGKVEAALPLPIAGLVSDHIITQIERFRNDVDGTVPFEEQNRKSRRAGKHQVRRAGSMLSFIRCAGYKRNSSKRKEVSFPFFSHSERQQQTPTQRM